MTLQASGPISLANVQTEYGGANPIAISEYYGVPGGLPASGTISLSNFYGKSNFLATWSGDSIAYNTEGLTYSMGFQISGGSWRVYYSEYVGEWITSYLNGTFSATSSRAGAYAYGIESSGNFARAYTTAPEYGAWLTFTMGAGWSGGVSIANSGFMSIRLNTSGGLLAASTKYGINTEVYGPYRSLY